MEKTKDSHNEGISMYEQMIRECEAMAKYAYAAGETIPNDVVEVLHRLVNRHTEASDTGESVENKLEGNFPDIKQLNTIHSRLTRIVKPAKPKTILLLEEESRKKGFFKFLGALPFIRRMMFVAFLCLVFFILISLSVHINRQPDTWDLFVHFHIPLLIKELFLLTAAGLGASFAALFKANRYIVRGTFDPAFEASYWIRFFLGLIAGLILAALIPAESVLKDFGKPLLAMLGGFSADVVNVIIRRLVETLGTAFKGDNRAKIEAKHEELNSKTEGDSARHRFKLAADLVKLRDQVGSNSDPEELKNKMTQLIHHLTEIDDDSLLN